MPSSQGSSFAKGDINKGNTGKGGHNKRGGMIKIMIRSTVRTRNAKSVVKKNICHIIAQTLKKINTTMTRAQVVPVVEQT